MTGCKGSSLAPMAWLSLKGETYEEIPVSGPLWSDAGNQCHVPTRPEHKTKIQPGVRRRLYYPAAYALRRRMFLRHVSGRRHESRYLRRNLNSLSPILSAVCGKDGLPAPYKPANASC